MWGVFGLHCTCRRAPKCVQTIFVASVNHSAFKKSSYSSYIGAKLQSLDVLAFSTYDFHLLLSWMQLIQFFVFNFFTSFLVSSSLMFFGLPCGHTDIGFHLFSFLYHSVFWHSMKWPNQLNRCVFM